MSSTNFTKSILEYIALFMRTKGGFTINLYYLLCYIIIYYHETINGQEQHVKVSLHTWFLLKFKL